MSASGQYAFGPPTTSQWAPRNQTSSMVSSRVSDSAFAERPVAAVDGDRVAPRDDVAQPVFFAKWRRPRHFHGVPQPEEVHRHGDIVSALQHARQVVDLLPVLRRAALRGQRVGGQRVLHDVVGAVGHHPDGAEHSGQRPRAVRAASGTEQEDPVLGLPVLGQEEVRVDDGSAGGRGDGPAPAAGRGVQQPGGVEYGFSGVVPGELAVVVGGEQPEQGFGIGRIPWTRTIACAVEAQDEVLHSKLPDRASPWLETLTVRVCQAMPGMSCVLHYSKNLPLGFRR